MIRRRESGNIGWWACFVSTSRCMERLECSDSTRSFPTIDETHFSTSFSHLVTYDCALKVGDVLAWFHRKFIYMYNFSYLEHHDQLVRFNASNIARAKQFFWEECFNLYQGSSGSWECQGFLRGHTLPENMEDERERCLAGCYGKIDKYLVDTRKARDGPSSAVRSSWTKDHNGRFTASRKNALALPGLALEAWAVLMKVGTDQKEWCG